MTIVAVQAEMWHFGAPGGNCPLFGTADADVSSGNRAGGRERGRGYRWQHSWGCLLSPGRDHALVAASMSTVTVSRPPSQPNYPVATGALRSIDAGPVRRTVRPLRQARVTSLAGVSISARVVATSRANTPLTALLS